MRYLLFLLFSLCCLSLMAQPYAGHERPVEKPIINKGAGCVPPSHYTIMQLNNVRAMIHTAGNLWQVPATNTSMYEVPKNSGIQSLFTAALWLGGTDVNGQLKLAALRYRQGDDYWNGPLTNLTANANQEDCFKYDFHFVTRRDEIAQFNSWFEAGLQDQLTGGNTQNQLYPNYKIPESIKNWPAHGDVSKGQDYHLAPFYDRDQDGTYDYTKGDYPWYDLTNEKECKVDREVSLYGHLNYWWVMNDKGNIHTETQGDPIGMEIRAQAFAFASNDDINNMTFYNYELINRSTQTLTDTYFGAFTDGALGNPFDDYVGCDVNRGLGYYYNGDNLDEYNAGFNGYGTTPPAVGVDFFEGPYQDNDGIDNAVGIGPGQALNGIGYGDGIVDNERYGMRRFLYYSNTTNGANPSQTDPIQAIDYYNYLKGFWKDGSKFVYGGSGHNSDPEATTIPCDFMFPGDTDPLGWGTNGSPQAPWTEQTANNVPNDRRFVQSAGPFILKPGAVNNITVGVVWARATAGGPFESVYALRRADDKAQALFENCFRLLEGPHAPDLAIQELENELILTLSNAPNSNNYGEEYEEFDPFISTLVPNADKFYRFQGYQIYQLANDEVSLADLEDVSKARLVAQCDIKDSVDKIINFEFDDNLQASIPSVKVNGENKGIRHSFRITEDAFAAGDNRLVNFKTYYYVAIAYAHNRFQKYDPTDPNLIFGQKAEYFSSRKAALGSVQVVAAVPHNPMPEAGGTYQNIEYGSTPQITRLDGTGNGGNALKLTSESVNTILSTGKLNRLTYDNNGAPINVKVIDPLNVVDGHFELKFRNYTTGIFNQADTASWVIYRYASEGGAVLDSMVSERTIKVDNEQLIPEWGVSVQIQQVEYFKVANGALTDNTPFSTDIISSSLTFADSSKRWLTAIPESDGFFPTNWIRSGTYSPTNPDDCLPAELPWANPCNYPDEVGYDNDKDFTKLASGLAAPHGLVGYQADYMPLAYHPRVATISTPRRAASLSFSSSVDIVITSDKSKWTRCPVIELGRDVSLTVGNAKHGELRKSPSKDINGNDIPGSTGMGWFPGYAIDLETGARLYMAFGENSFHGADGGADMIWNPSSRLFDATFNPILGGVQPIWVFGTNSRTINANPSKLEDFPEYIPSVGASSSNYLEVQFAAMDNTANGTPVVNQIAKSVYGNLQYVLYPMLLPNRSLLGTDATISLRMNKQYKDYVATGSNSGRGHYSWNMSSIRTETGSADALAEALEMINVVPNPYYAFSEYERNRLDTRVKITNLPEICEIKIYNTSGKLIRSFKKDSPVTSVDWDLNNTKGIPIASGMYIIHIDVPGAGERVLKFFAGMRQVDLQGT